MFDITKPLSFENVPNWIKHLSSANSDNPIPLVLIGNKNDLRDNDDIMVSQKQAEDLVESLKEWSGFDIEYIETSALTGENVVEAFEALVTKIDLLDKN